MDDERSLRRRRTLKRIVVGVLLAAFAIALWRFTGSVPPQELADRIPAWAALALLAFGPLLGLPVSWLHVLTGLRFGFWPGLAAVAATTLLHHLGGWTLCHVRPEWIPSSLDKWRRQLERAGHLDALLFCALLPGMPYTVELYLLPAIGVPLRLLASLGTTINTARAVVTLLIGEMASDASFKRAWVLGAYYLILAVVSALALRRLRKRSAGVSGDKDDRRAILPVR